jgi:hypothetical protein
MRDFVLSEEVRERKARATEKATASIRIPIIVEDLQTNKESEYISLVEAGKASALPLQVCREGETHDLSFLTREGGIISLPRRPPGEEYWN